MRLDSVYVCSAVSGMAGKLVRSVGFIGAGNIANALTRGFLAAKIVDKSNLIASAPNEEAVADMKVGKYNRNVLFYKKYMRIIV